MPCCIATCGDAGQPGERHRVADDEDLGVARQRAVGSNGHPARTVALRSGCLGQDAREGRGLHAGRPDDRVRRRCAPGRSETRRPCRRRRCSSRASRCGPRRRCARARSWPSGTADRRTRRRICLSASKRSTAALVGSIARKSCSSVRRASSAICPATSQPVGPPPTTAKVSHLRRSASEGAVSASSNAAKIRRRRLRASSIVFIGRECCGELVVSEVRGRRSGGDDQAVVGQRERRSQRPDGDDRPVLEIEAGDLGQLDLDVLVLAQDSPERRCDLALREDSRCDLVEQRLKEVVVRAVDERDVDVALPKELRGKEATEAAADDDHTVASPLMVRRRRSLGLRARSDQAATGAPTNSSSALLTSSGMRPGDVVRPSLDRDELDVVEQRRQPRCGRLVGQDPVLRAVDDQHRDVDLRQIASEVGQPGVHARVGRERRAAGGDVEARLPGGLADPVGHELVDVVEVVEEVLEVRVAVLRRSPP